MNQENEQFESTGPKFVSYFGPLLDALRELKGSATTQNAIDKVAEIADTSPQNLGEKTNGGNPKFDNQVRWAIFYLCRARLIDSKARGMWDLTESGSETHLDYKSALDLFRQVYSRFQDSSADEEAPAPDPMDGIILGLFDDQERSFWFVGAKWGDEDQTERFLHEGIWVNGYEDRSDHVQRMKPGDLIAIKASFTQKHGLPFKNHGKAVSCMRIKATGRVSEQTQDGQTVKVDWDPTFAPKDWYFRTYRVTMAEAKASDELNRRLIRFTFGAHKQDYDFWLRQPHFAKKYRESLPIEEDEDDDQSDPGQFGKQSYGVPDIVSDGCFLPEEDIREALEHLKRKKNLILQGPPGTGKTWLSKRIGYAKIGTCDRHIINNRMRVIQFHPSLSYEDFVRGWRPDGNGQLKLIDGVFLEAVNAAHSEPDLPFVVIIEEINRGNPAQNFGEMLTLLENDKRREEEAIELAYQSHVDERVFIPDNLYVIGTMNIADRSLALVDLALRRRFAFVTLKTMLNERWRTWCREEAGLDDDSISNICQAMTELNNEIARDSSLGPQFRIGHSYVTPAKDEKIGDPQAWFRRIVLTEITPLLEEYWYDNPDSASTASKRLADHVGNA
ncbi:MAG: AAA family ATPase [Aestuariivita sp.]|nr:AAA family ATPase [Aestuariivita sp.]